MLRIIKILAIIAFVGIPIAYFVLDKYQWAVFVDILSPVSMASGLLTLVLVLYFIDKYGIESPLFQKNFEAVLEFSDRLRWSFFSFEILGEVLYFNTMENKEDNSFVVSPHNAEAWKPVLEKYGDRTVVFRWSYTYKIGDLLHGEHRKYLPRKILDATKRLQFNFATYNRLEEVPNNEKLVIVSNTNYDKTKILLAPDPEQILVVPNGMKLKHLIKLFNELSVTVDKWIESKSPIGGEFNKDFF